MNNKTKIIIVLCFLLCCFILFSFANGSESFDELIDVTVNQENGNVSFVWFDGDYFRIKCVNRDGIALFTHSIAKQNGVVYLQFQGNQLLAYITSLKELRFYEMDGSLSRTVYGTDSDSELIAQIASQAWKGWKKEKGKRIYRMDDVYFTYQSSSFFQQILNKGWCTLTIYHSDEDSIIIYQSGTTPS